MLESDLSPSVNDDTVYLKDYAPSRFLISDVYLEFFLRDEKTLVKSRLKLSKNTLAQHDATEKNQILSLNGESLTLVSLKLDGKTLSKNEYHADEEFLTIRQVPNEFELEIETELEPKLNTELSGLYQSSGNFCTQCEAEGFRRITYFLDRPDVLATYTVRVTAEQTACPVLLSNGNLLEHGANDDGTHWALWHDPHPKPSYLFALVAGDLQRVSDTYLTMSGKKVELHVYTQAHNIHKCDHAMQSLIHSMRWDEQCYGREYDLDIYNIVAVDDFNMGAMENKGLNVFNSKYVLANQQSATDTDYEGIESVIGHEYFHNWSGNRVTCRDWFQLSLKEGFTVFRDQEFSADQGSRAVKRIRDVQVLRAHQFKEDAGPMAHPVRPESYQEINNFYTVTIYEKGAEVIRMMRGIVGAKGFRKGSDLYFDRHDGQAVTTEDFVLCMEQANKVDLGQFRRWYSQSGTPSVNVEQEFKNNTLTLSFTQSCPPTPGQTHKEPFHIPIKFALFGESGSKIQEAAIDLCEPTQEVSFTGLTERPVVSMLRDFSAPVKLRFAQSEQELMQLIKVDDNGFARWEAMQKLSLNVLLPAIKDQKLSEKKYSKLRQVFESLLQGEHEDLAILAEMLSLPNTNYLSEQCIPIDPQAVVHQRNSVFKRLAIDLQELWLKQYTYCQAESFELSSKAMAQRSLKNTALKYLVACEQEAYYDLALAQYREADNMTDGLAAFVCLVESDFSGRDALIESFYEQWQHDALVMDKWFAIQASSQHTATLGRVINLMTHTSFSINNPNKVRALIGAFTGNLKEFHREDGEGYTFIADQIIALNAINPQIAARLAGAFNSWRKYANHYSLAMAQQLDRIAAQDNLSKDVREIIDKARISM